MRIFKKNTADFHRQQLETVENLLKTRDKKITDLEARLNVVTMQVGVLND